MQNGILTGLLMDFYELEQDPDNIAYLAKQVHNLVLCHISTKTDAYINI